MTDCIFCKIIKGEMPSYKVFENEHVIAFLDIFPSVTGHMMVIHKKHGTSVLDYSQDELGELMEGVKIMSGKIQKTFHSDSITIGINHLEKRGVPHLHVHLIPRFDNDNGGVIQSVVNAKPKEDFASVVEQLTKE